MEANMVNLERILEARARISPYVYKTPLLRMESLDALLGCEVYVKAECLQRTNSFKIRGALNKMLFLGAEKLAGGVVAASSGNHGKGVAFAAKLLGVKATIVVPETAPRIKVEGIQAYGADVIICKLAERHEIAKRLSEEKGFTLISPYDDYDIMAGQGTVGLEIMEQLPDADCVVVPVGGGGLIGGVSTAVKALKPSAKVIGAEPARMPRYSRSIEAGMPVTIEECKCIADALLTLRPGERNFPIIQRNVDAFVTSKDESMAMGMKLLLLEGRILAEPSSAVGIGSALQRELPVKPGDKVCFVVSGGSVGLEQVQRILAEVQ